MVRALTGWGTQGRAFRSREADHDDGEKVLFGRRGRFQGEEAIDLVMAQPACARFIARRLLEEFVAPAPKESWIDDTAQTLVESEWQIGETIEAILRSELFFSPGVRRSHDRISRSEHLFPNSAISFRPPYPRRLLSSTCYLINPSMWTAMRISFSR